MNDKPEPDDAELLARAALRRGAAPGDTVPPCSCFSTVVSKPFCTTGLCEDTVKHVAVVIRALRAALVHEAVKEIDLYKTALEETRADHVRAVDALAEARGEIARLKLEAHSTRANEEAGESM